MKDWAKIYTKIVPKGPETGMQSMKALSNMLCTDRLRERHGRPLKTKPPFSPAKNVQKSNTYLRERVAQS